MMNWKTLVVAGAVAGLAVGCGDSSSSGSDAGPSGSDAGPGQTVTFVVDSISVPTEPGTGDTAFGFNLDGKVSDGASGATCEDLAIDYTSATDGSTGVDNQFVGELGGTLAGFVDGGDLSSAVQAQIAEGDLLLAMEVSDVQSFTSDSSVSVDLYLVKPSDCTEDSCAPADGAVEAGASWTARSDVAAFATNLTGTIEDGTITLHLDSLPLSLNISGTALTLVISDATFAGDISEDGVTNAAIGGSVVISDLVELANGIDSSYGPLVESVAGPYADIDPSTDDETVCNAISIGIGFSAVAGTVE